MTKYPSVVYFRITSECNHNCKYCYSTKNIKTLSLLDLRKVFCLLQTRGVKALTLCGGEPLIRKDIVRIFQELREQDFKVFLDTNGDLFFKYQKEIEKSVNILGLPLDFSSGELTSGYRGKENFDTVLKILNYYKTNQKPFVLEIRTVITQDNINDINKLAELLKNKDIDLWKLYEFTPLGEGRLNEIKLRVDIAKFDDLTRNIKRQYSKYLNIVVSSRRDRNSAYFLINSDGSVFMPVDTLKVCKEVILGNIFDEDIFDKWKKLVITNNYKMNILRTFGNEV